MPIKWKGNLKFGLVTVPVRMLTAVSHNSETIFSLIHKECGQRIKQQTICPHCDRNVSEEDVVRGYEYSPGQYVTERELFKARRHMDSIEVVAFADEDEISPIYFHDSDYLVPQKAEATAFAVFRQALIETKKVAIAQGIIRSAENFYAIQPYHNILIAHTLRYAEDVKEANRDIAGLPMPIDPKMVEIAKEIIGQMEKRFIPSEYVNEQKKSLRTAIDARMRGKETTMAPTTPKPESLMEALKESLEQSKEQKKLSQAVKEETRVRRRGLPRWPCG